MIKLLNIIKHYVFAFYYKLLNSNTVTVDWLCFGVLLVRGFDKDFTQLSIIAIQSDILDIKTFSKHICPPDDNNYNIWKESFLRFKVFGGLKHDKREDLCF